MLRTDGGDAVDADDEDALLRRFGEAVERAVATSATLKADHERTNVLFENTSDAMVDLAYVDGTPVVTGVNAAFERTFGGIEAVADGVVFERTGTDRGHAVVGDAERAVLADESAAREIRLWTRDGARDFLLRAVLFEVGDATHGYLIYTDITARKRSERVLGRLHETTRNLVRASSDEEIVDIAVAAASDILGYPVVALRVYDPETDSLAVRGVSGEGESLLGTDATADSTAVDDVARAVFDAGEPRVVDADDHVTASGGRLAQVMYLPLGEQGVLTLGAATPTAFDAAERRLAQILAANVEVALDRADQTRLLRSREDELQRQNDRLEEFASVVSHDLRNPLSVARGYFDLLRSEYGLDERPDAEEHVARVDRSHERMNRLITDLLALAREGQSVGETESVRLGTVARTAWGAVDTGTAVFEVTADRAMQADGERLNTLLENLFRNAVEHGSAEETLHVRVGALDDGFYVEDDGPGIPADDRDAVFDRGYTTSDDGTGFGLSIVDGIVQAHGWTIRVTAGADGGARFEVGGVRHAPREGSS